MEGIFAVAEIYLPASLFSFCIAQLEMAFERRESGFACEVPALMVRLRQVAVDANLKAEHQPGSSELGLCGICEGVSIFEEGAFSCVSCHN